MRNAAAILTTLAITLAAKPADACSLVTNDIHQVDPEQSGDTVPPGSTRVVTAKISREQDDSSGCVAGCGSRGVITLELDAEDAGTTPDRMGYLVTIVNGNAPAGFFVEEEPVTSFGGPLHFYFDFEAPRVFVELEIRAVDLNGNVGLATLISLEELEQDDGGCAVAPSGALASLGLVGFALAFALRRRRP
jgi:MYXO-CTERM domain-containing protein